MKENNTNIKKNVIIFLIVFIAIAIISAIYVNESSKIKPNVENDIPYTEPKNDIDNIQPTESHRAQPNESNNTYAPSTNKSSSKTEYHDSYDDGYNEVYDDGDYDWDRYYEDDDYASGVDDALDDWDEYGEDW